MRQWFSWLGGWWSWAFRRKAGPPVEVARLSNAYLERVYDEMLKEGGEELYERSESAPDYQQDFKWKSTPTSEED